MCIALGKVVVAGLLAVVANEKIGVPFTAVYILVSILSAIFTIFAYFGMKDVDVAKKEKSNVSGFSVFKKGLKIVFSTP